MEKEGGAEEEITAGGCGEMAATVTAATFVGELDIGRKTILIGG